MGYTYQGLMVGFALLIIWVSWGWTTQRQVTAEAEKHLIAQYGCQRPQPLQVKWPLALDKLMEAFEYSKKKQLLRWMGKIMDSTPPTFEQNLLGSRSVNTIDPRNIEAVLSTNFKDYCLGLREPTFRPLLGNGIFTQDGPAWKQSRHLLRPQLASNRPQNFEHLQTCVQNMMEALPDSGTVDLLPFCFRLTFNTTLYLLFGDFIADAGLGNLAERESEFASAFNIAQEYLAYRGRLGPFYWLYTSKEFRKACQTCHEFVDEAVAKASQRLEAEEHKEHTKQSSLEEIRGSSSFVEALLQQTTDPQTVRDQCLNVLLAGRDTTGTCLQWSFRLLARHQDVLDRLRSEIQRVCGLGSAATHPAKEDLKDDQKSQMPYLHMVIREVLRLYPSVPLNSREAASLTVLPVGGGPDGQSPILIRPGEAVGYCAYVMHRRKDIYGEDANEFRPDRWENGALKDVGWGYLPFNGGPRICLGQEFAWLEIAYTLVRMIQVFPQIQLPPNEPTVPVGLEKQDLTLVVSSAEGCLVHLGSEV